MDFQTTNLDNWGYVCEKLHLHLNVRADPRPFYRSEKNADKYMTLTQKFQWKHGEGEEERKQ